MNSVEEGNRSTPSTQIDERLDTSQQTIIHHSNEFIQATREDEEALVKYRELKNICNSCSFVLLAADPITYDEATKDNEWITAMNEELEAIRRNETWG